MRAMVANSGSRQLQLVSRPVPEPGPGEVLLKVRACAVCRTDLHLVDGELPSAAYPVIPGHEIVGELAACGPGVELPPAARLGVPWLGWTCGRCERCTGGEENLCAQARFTGCHLNGGYAEFVVADARYCLPVPDGIDDVHAAPLLCAGLIGHRALKMCGRPRRLGLYGFGAAAHLVAQIARRDGILCYAFARPGDTHAVDFALELGCAWAGPSDRAAPAPLDAAIIFAPVGSLVPVALAAVRPGGTVVCGGIHMSDIPSFPYALLWGERTLRSVANLTRADGIEFMALAAALDVRPQVEIFALGDANEALARLRRGELTGAAVLMP